MGFGFYLFWPAFYTDVTDSYRLGRGGRLRTDLGGLYFNAIVVLLAFGVWWLTGWHALLLIVATQVLQMIRQLAPMLRFDGYHVLADVTGVPDLYQRIGPILTGLLPGRWRQPEATALKTWARVVVTLWVLAVVPLMLFSMLLMVLSLPRLLATAWVSVRGAERVLSRNFGDGDVLGVIARALAIVVLIVPLLGIAYVLVRLVRRTVRARCGAPRAGRSAGRWPRWSPPRWSRAWPGPGGRTPDRYRPVRAYEGGTVLDAVPRLQQFGAARRRAGRGDHHLAGRRRAAAHRRPPGLAMVMTPRPGPGRAGTTARHLGLPVRPPAAAGDRRQPGPGGQHHRRIGDVRRLVQPRLGRRLDRAEQERGVRVRQLHRLPHRRRGVPGRPRRRAGRRRRAAELSGAVNYACVRCVTQALATQLVVSVPGALTDAQNAQLAAVWKDLQAFGAHIQDVPLAELRDRLTEFEPRILDVVAPQAAAPRRAPGPASTPARRGPAAGARRRRDRRGRVRPRLGRRQPRRPRRDAPATASDPPAAPTTRGRGDGGATATPPADRRRAGRSQRGEWGAIPSSPPGGPVSESSAVAAVHDRDLLGIYCNDHLAAATGGIELVSRMLGRHRGTAERAEARAAARRAAGGADRAARLDGRARLPVRQYKLVASWVGEKLARLKLNGHLLSRSPLSDLIEFEFIATAVLAKRCGFETLRVVAAADQRLDAERIDRLIAQADKQHDWLAAPAARSRPGVFGGDPGPGAPRAAAGEQRTVERPMCHDHDSRPPAPPRTGDVAERGVLTLTSSDGTEFSAAYAAPAGQPRVGVVVLPDIRGLHPYYVALAERFAEAGAATVAIDYFGRTAGVCDATGTRPEDFDWQATSRRRRPRGSTPTSPRPSATSARAPARTCRW